MYSKPNSGRPVSDYSTFIQELESAADKLMNQVFDLSSTAPMPSPIRKAQSKKVNQHSFQNFKIDNSTPRIMYKPTKKVTNLENTIKIKNFMARTNNYQKQKSRKLQQLHRSLQQSIQRQHTFRPQINHSSENLKIKSLRKRCLDIQQSKQKKLFEQRTQKKMKQQKQLNQISFQPKINTISKKRTFKEYYDEKIRWQKKKLQGRQKRKQLDEIKKHTQCIFKPNLETQKSTFYKKNQKLNSNTKVQNRLLQRLQMSSQKRLKL